MHAAWQVGKSTLAVYISCASSQKHFKSNTFTLYAASSGLKSGQKVEVNDGDIARFLTGARLGYNVGTNMNATQTNAAYELAVRKRDSSDVSGHRDMLAFRNGLGASVKLGFTALQADSRR